jgi:Fe-S-cluster containining protein
MSLPPGRLFYSRIFAGSMQTDLQQIARLAEEKEPENMRFRAYLKTLDIERLDHLVHALNAVVEPQIDCTVCGNCCRTLMINTAPRDIERLAVHLKLPVPAVLEHYIETSETGEMQIMNQIPCHFLQADKCTVYEARPEECRVFPGLHLENFSGRMFATFMHYGRCPIIFNVVEQLKTALQYQPG